MAVDRAAAYAALAARLQAEVRPLLASDVRRKLPDQIDAVQQPALAVIAESETPANDGPLPALWTLNAVVVIYARCDGYDTSTAEGALADIVRSVEAALERQPDEAMLSWGQQVQAWSTLGGTVLYARPSGIHYTAGQTEDQGVALVSIEMVMQPA